MFVEDSIDLQMKYLREGQDFKTHMLFRFLILIHVCAAFPLKCPEPAQWSLRARGHCPDPSKYFCLKNDLINGYSENCTVIDFLQPGRKHVLRGGLDADICSPERFQPWPINFYTNVSTNCIFLKSTCNEEGQVIYEKGNRNSDTTCRCDYTRGYNFLFKPRNPCFCVPSQEDCSCFLKGFPKSTDILSPDYEPLHVENNITLSECKLINERVIPASNETVFISRREHISNNVQKRITLIYICLGLIILYSMIVLTDELLDRYYREAYYLYKPFSHKTIIEGDDFELTYKLSTHRVPIRFLRNGHLITEEKNVTRRIAGCWKTLKITGVTLNDAGFYCLEVSNKKSEPVELSVQRVFTSKIEPHECIEGSTIQLTCSVYADNIEIKWYKEKHELQCQRYLITSSEHGSMLTIKNTTVGDSGMYHVKAINVQMKIPVTVKAIITRPLENVTIMEGLDTVLECETEEENRPVQWFKNGKEISNQSDIIKRTGNLHNLTILQTSLDDSGTYTVKTKGRTSHAVLTVKEMPATIKQMSVQEKDEFLKAAKSGTTIRYDCRVMIVGENEVGKTCLLRRLMNEKIDDVQSTDGINILRRKCQINIKSGEWHFPTADQVIQPCASGQSEEFADCGFWDFAGQKEFYATHQTFLSTNSVYLLVVDISRDFKTKTFNNMIEKEFNNVGEYIDFWLDNIHCYSIDDKNISRHYNVDGLINPPVIIIGTGIDKIEEEEEVEEERENKGHRKCNYCKHMSVYKCYDCNQVLCRDCSRKHGNTEKYNTHLMQLISDSFILNCKFYLEADVNGITMNDIICLPDGEVVTAVYNTYGLSELLVFSISGKRRHVIKLDNIPKKMDVVDKNTVAVLLRNDIVAIIDIQQNHFQYIRDIAISYNSGAFMYIEYEFYIGNAYEIFVIDMSGSIKRRIKLSFTPFDTCYDVDSKRIYCIGSEHSQLLCIDKDGTIIFSFTDPSMIYLKGLTIDNEGNVFVLCIAKVGYVRFSVVKVDSNSENSEVVIAHNYRSFSGYSCICYDHLSNSVVIGLGIDVYIYKKKIKL